MKVEAPGLELENPPPEEKSALEREQEILNFRKNNFRLYRDLQLIFLIKKYGGRKEFEENFAKAVELHAAEYQLAFDAVIGDKMVHESEFAKHPISYAHEEAGNLLLDIESKIETLYALEQALFKYLNQTGEGENLFLKWHEKYGKKFIEIIRQNPKLLEEFKTNQEETTEKIEKLLYAPEEMEQRQFDKAA